MDLKFRARNAQKLGVLALAGAALGAWHLAAYANARLAELEVKLVAKRQTMAPPLDASKLFPVWVVGTRQPTATERTGEMEKLFQAARPLPEVVAPALPPQPDYAALLGSQMVLESITTDGAFINGKYYRVGERIPDFSYPKGASDIVPMLAAVRAASVLIVHGSRKTEIHL